MLNPRTALSHTNLARLFSAASLGAAALLAGCSGGGTSSGSANPSAFGGRYLLALGDADLPSEPFGSALLTPKPGSKDTLTIISLPIREPSTPFSQADVSSSALGSPGEITVSPDGRFAFVAEARGPAPAGSDRNVASLPIGDSFTSIDLSNLQAPVVLGKTFVGPSPRALAVHPSGAYLAVVTTNPRNQLTISPLSNGRAGEAVSWPLIGLDDDEAVPTSVAWHPSGRAVAISLGDRGEVVFYRFRANADGLALAPWSGPIKVGKQPIMGVFTKDGKYFISLDAGHASGKGASEPAGPGNISVIRLSNNVDGDDTSATHTVASNSATGVAPVGMALSPDGSMIVVANSTPATPGQGWQGGSLRLFAFGRDGSLTPHTEVSLGAAPAGVSFDTSGRFVCVSQYASLDPEASDGEVSFWKVTNEKGTPSLAQQPYFLGIGGGPHGALIVR